MICPFCMSENIYDIRDIDHRICYCDDCKKYWYEDDD